MDKLFLKIKKQSTVKRMTKTHVLKMERQLRRQSRKPETEFSDFAREFFMILFYPIGIWIIQPRINKLSPLYEIDRV